MGKKRLTVEQAQKLRAEREELRQLRNLRDNLQSGIVYNISPEMMRVLMTRNWRDL